MQFLCFYRESLPHDYMNYMGVANLESSARKREAFTAKLKSLVDKLFDYASPDAASDQVCRPFLLCWLIAVGHLLLKLSEPSTGLFCERDFPPFHVLLHLLEVFNSATSSSP